MATTSRSRALPVMDLLICIEPQHRYKVHMSAAASPGAVDCCIDTSVMQV